MNIPFLKEKNSPIVKVAIIAGVLLSLFLLVKTVNAVKEFNFIGEGTYPESTITFTGMGEVFAVPDVATFTFSVTKEANDVGEAQRQVEDVVSKAADVLDDEGVDDSDIKTVNYNVYPRYEYRQENSSLPSKRVFVGYEVTQTTEVKVRDAGTSGEILGKIGSLDITNISGLSFEIDDEDDLKRDARKKAIDEAKEKAEALAKDLDIKLVRILNFHESTNDGPYPYYKNEYGMGGDAVMNQSAPRATINTGENKITSQVSITYEIR